MAVEPKWEADDARRQRNARRACAMNVPPMEGDDALSAREARKEAYRKSLCDRVHADHRVMLQTAQARVDSLTNRIDNHEKYVRRYEHSLVQNRHSSKYQRFRKLKEPVKPTSSELDDARVSLQVLREMVSEALVRINAHVREESGDFSERFAAFCK